MRPATFAYWDTVPFPDAAGANSGSLYNNSAFSSCKSVMYNLHQLVEADCWRWRRYATGDRGVRGSVVVLPSGQVRGVDPLTGRGCEKSVRTGSWRRRGDGLGGVQNRFVVGGQNFSPPRFPRSQAAPLNCACIVSHRLRWPLAALSSALVLTAISPALATDDSAANRRDSDTGIPSVERGNRGRVRNGAAHTWSYAALGEQNGTQAATRTVRRCLAPAGNWEPAKAATAASIPVPIPRPLDATAQISLKADKNQSIDGYLQLL